MPIFHQARHFCAPLAAFTNQRGYVSSATGFEDGFFQVLPGSPGVARKGPVLVFSDHLKLEEVALDDEEGAMRKGRFFGRAGGGILQGPRGTRRQVAGNKKIPMLFSWRAHWPLPQLPATAGEAMTILHLPCRYALCSMLFVSCVPFVFMDRHRVFLDTNLGDYGGRRGGIRWVSMEVRPNVFGRSTRSKRF